MDFIDANTLAVGLLGDAIYANPLLLGYAWQKGWVPLAEEALLRAIELNAVAVDANKAAFDWGRRCAVDLAAVEKLVAPSPRAQVIEFHRPAGAASGASAKGLQALIATRVAYLGEYQNAAYAARYAALVEKVRGAEQRAAPARSDDSAAHPLATAVARYYFKLLAYKDEYEVARLHARAQFRDAIAAQFEGEYKLRLHLAPPLLARVDPKTGRPRKISFGPWMLTAFGVLARFRFLRGTAFDPFGRSEERRAERALIVRYERLVEELLEGLGAAATRGAARDDVEIAQRIALAVELASIPERIRGFGPVKRRHLDDASLEWEQLLARWRGELPARSKAA